MAGRILQQKYEHRTCSYQWKRKSCIWYMTNISCTHRNPTMAWHKINNWNERKWKQFCATSVLEGVCISRLDCSSLLFIFNVKSVPSRLVRESQGHAASSQLSHMRKNEMDSYINVSLTNAETEDSSSQKPRKRCNQPWWTGERWCADSASSCPGLGSCQLPPKSTAKAKAGFSFCIAQPYSAQVLFWLTGDNSSELQKHQCFSLQTRIFSKLIRNKPWI